MSTVSSSTTSTTAYKVTADTTGTLVLQTGSTPTTAVTIDGSQNVTFAKGFTVGATAAPAFSAYINVNQSIATATFTKVQFNTEEFDTNSNYDNATNYRFTPTVAGYYQVNSVVNKTASSVEIQTIIYKNGSAFKSGNDNSSSYGASVSALVYMNGTTDYVEIYTYFSTSGLTTATVSGTYFQAAMVRSA